MRLGIDASNISSGGGIIHLQKILENAEPRKLTMMAATPLSLLLGYTKNGIFGTIVAMVKKNGHG